MQPIRRGLAILVISLVISRRDQVNVRLRENDRKALDGIRSFSTHLSTDTEVIRYTLYFVYAIFRRRAADRARRIRKGRTVK